MTSRDLLQQRSTLPNGDTVWTPSALLKAAIDGKIAVLDGLHRINTGTLFTIQRCTLLLENFIFIFECPTTFFFFLVLYMREKRNFLMDLAFFAMIDTMLFKNT
jgi:hypothetical protein